MVKLTKEDPAELRRKVTSPNGATQASIEALDRYQFSEAIVTSCISFCGTSQRNGRTNCCAKPRSEIRIICHEV